MGVAKILLNNPQDGFKNGLRVEWGKGGAF